MLQPLTLAATLTTATAALGACTQTAEVPEERDVPVYLGAEAMVLDRDMIRFNVAMTGAGDAAGVEAYGRCIAAGYAVDGGFGFARQVRTIVRQDGRTWFGDAVYLVSATRPEGLRTIDAPAARAECGSLGIPTV